MHSLKRVAMRHASLFRNLILNDQARIHAQTFETKGYCKAAEIWQTPAKSNPGGGGQESCSVEIGNRCRSFVCILAKLAGGYRLRRAPDVAIKSGKFEAGFAI